MGIGSLEYTQSYYLDLLTQLLTMDKLFCLANKMSNERKILPNQTVIKENLHFIRSTHLQLTSNTQTKRLRNAHTHTKKTIMKLKH